MALNFFMKPVRGKKYLYLGETRRVNGRTKRVWQKYIGTPENMKRRLESSPIPRQVESVEFGLSVAALKTANNVRFTEIVNRHCPKRKQGLSVGDHILIDLINRLSCPFSHNKLGTWFSKTVLRSFFSVKAGYLSSQGYWNHWQYFDEQKIEDIQKDLLPHIIKNIDIEQLLYDPTNFTTFIADEHKDNPKGKKRHKVSLPKYGHAKNGLKGLRQINLALLVTKDYGIPLWHKPFEGNINDYTFFKTFIKSMRDKIEIFLRECKSITLIFDKGNNTPISIKKIGKDLHFYMLGSLAPSQYKDWLKIPPEKFNIEYKTAKKETTKGHYFRSEIFGKMCSIVLTYNKRTAFKQRKRTERKLNKALAYLKEAEKKLNKPKWKNYEEVLLRINTNITQFNAKNVVKWELSKEDESLILKYDKNEEELKYLESSYGKSILFTDNNFSAVDIIATYHGKYVIEQKIRQLKNKHVISFTPNYCWTDESIRVHSFTCVMALLLLSLLKKRVAESGIKLSDEEIVEKLRGIRQGIVLMPEQIKAIRIIEKMDKEQNRLFSALQLGKPEN